MLRALLPVLDAVDRACANEPLTPGLKNIADSLQEQFGPLGVPSFGEVGEVWSLMESTCSDLYGCAAPPADGFDAVRPAHVP